jgi:rod shape-determining protein MreC
VALVDIRQRAGYLFVAVLLGHIILISAQVNARAGVPVLEAVVFGVFARVQGVTAAVASSVRQVWRGYIGLRGVRAENAALKQQLAAAQIQLQQERASADRVRGLVELLELRDRTNLETTAAEIIAAGATPDFRTLTIDKGSRHGIRPDMAVIAAAGVVGRIVVPSGGAAKVQLLIDRNAAAGAIVERSRAQGLVVGTGEERLRMEYVSEIADVEVGDTIVTSGIDGIYPKGFVIGSVATVEKSSSGFKEIAVRPAVDFTTLEQVLVVLTSSPSGDAAEGSSP